MTTESAASSDPSADSRDGAGVVPEAGLLRRALTALARSRAQSRSVESELPLATAS